MNHLRRRVGASFTGLSPETVALSVVLGVVLGTFPVYGLPTLLCALASVIFGASLPAVQIVNQLATPLQLAMVLPFVRIGTRVIGSGHAAPWHWDPATLALKAIVGWLIVCVPLGLLSHVGMMLLLRRRPSARHLLQRPAAAS